jgi:hypothetical protein
MIFTLTSFLNYSWAVQDHGVAFQQSSSTTRTLFVPFLLEKNIKNQPRVTHLPAWVHQIFANDHMSQKLNFFNYNRLCSVKQVRRRVEWTSSQREQGVRGNASPRKPFLLSETRSQFDTPKQKNLYQDEPTVLYLKRVAAHYGRLWPFRALGKAHVVSSRKQVYTNVLTPLAFKTQFFFKFGMGSIPEWSKAIGLEQSYDNLGLGNTFGAGLSVAVGTYSTYFNDDMLEFCHDGNLAVQAYRYSRPAVRNLKTLEAGLLNQLPYRDTPSLQVSHEWSADNPMTNSIQSSVSYSPTQLLLSNSKFNKYFYTNPLLFKYFLWNSRNTFRHLQDVFNKATFSSNMAELGRFHFSTRLTVYQRVNLWPASMFSYTVKRRVTKVVNNTKFTPITTMWYYTTLVRFMEHHTGRKVYLRFNPFIENAISFADYARSEIWGVRAQSYQRLLGHRIFVTEAMKIFHLAFRFKDPTFLTNWIKAMMYRTSFWKYRVFFRFIKHVMKSLFLVYFPVLDMKGFRLKISGKISVGGNSRTRTILYRIGETSHATVNNRALSEFTTIESFTGVMGFRLTFYW